MTAGRVFVEGLYKSFGSSGLLAKWEKRVLVLKGINFELAPGELAALVGESGSGKTTIGRCLMGLLPIDKGTVRVNGYNVDELRGREDKAFRLSAQMVFQNPYASLNPAFRGRDALLEAVRIHDRSISRHVARKEVEKLAKIVQLPLQRLDEFPTSLSGGEKRRVIFARALATNPSFIVTDEPVSGLDQPIQTQLLDLLRQIHEKQRTTMVFISHDLRLVRYISTRVLVLLHGRIVEDAPAELFFGAEGPSHPYSQELLASAFNPYPMLKDSRVRKPPAGGERGCSFRHRCKFAQRGSEGKCDNIIPELKAVSEKHKVACHCI
ncbi:MAG: peptide ABC transporter ATP-binding protein [Deltaproteobacteria bacterium]|nr:MAG: peptide ABC transporter ATP-binding protein [Deltaproteobacteria bacterium]